MANYKLPAQLFLWMIIQLFSRTSHADPKIYSEILSQAKVTSGDSPSQRIEKVLPVIEEWIHKFDPNNGPNSQYNLRKEEVDTFYKKYKVPLPNQPANSEGAYALDSQRTADEMLSEQIGGACGTHGLSLATLLLKSGIKKEHIKIFGSVYYKDYLDLCRKKNKPRRNVDVEKSPNDGNGHIFVAIRENGQWKLVNPTARHLEAIEIPDPEVLKQHLEKGLPYVIPNRFPGLQQAPKEWQDVFTKMILFDVWDVDTYPKHTFDERLDLIASGEIGNKKCRFDPKEVRKLHFEQQTDKSKVNAAPSADR